MLIGRDWYCEGRNQPNLTCFPRLVSLACPSLRGLGSQSGQRHLERLADLWYAPSSNFIWTVIWWGYDFKSRSQNTQQPDILKPLWLLLLKPFLTLLATLELSMLNCKRSKNILNVLEWNLICQHLEMIGSYCENIQRFRYPRFTVSVGFALFVKWFVTDLF